MLAIVVEQRGALEPAEHLALSHNDAAAFADGPVVRGNLASAAIENERDEAYPRFSGSPCVRTER
jgi:hypothetical protein